MKVNNEYDIVLCNDDKTSFQTVISALCSICNHNNLQAEQCATIVHYNGECKIKERQDKIVAMQYVDLLAELGLNVYMQKREV